MEQAQTLTRKPTKVILLLCYVARRLSQIWWTFPKVLFDALNLILVHFLLFRCGIAQFDISTARGTEKCRTDRLVR